MNLDKALDILEVNNPNEVKIDELKTISKKAKKRWHPDTIAGLNPSQEKISEYEENFKLVEEAIAILESFIKGNYHNSESAYKGQQKSYQKSSEEILREEAPNMQSILKSVFAEVKKKKYMFSEEEIVLSEGDKVKDLMNQDLKEEVPYFAVVGYFYSGYIGLILLIFGFLLGAVLGETAQKIVAIGIILYAVFQSLVCLGLILPMSRFWLPLKVSDIMVNVTNFNVNFFNNFIYRVGSVWHFIFGIPRFFARIFYFFIFILYQPFILIFGNKVVRRVVIKQAYYANFADWYIEELMNSKISELTDEKLFHLGDMYSNLSKVND
jgi:hypothetical protein